ncbi:hypothetical protein AG1IA_07964 [Rhizoctonia solani AG-1 IA]|uniref:Ricin B lectin domain-containing protein n=1 Tax=Thanatephorus cucumeris (strain AG1-IA) TaxID=983506 RepID=L8WJA1_THACA|nr:hypothetical protein AG1IA_07964 [Rhizoctonia solani AG-1 IA]
MLWTGSGSKFTLRNVKTNNYLSYGRAQNSDRIVTSKSPKHWFIMVADKGYAVAAAENPLYVLDLTESNPANETVFSTTTMPPTTRSGASTRFRTASSILAELPVNSTLLN